jgi:FKBP-type peptidyl-prolyl cis-trans isomerase
MRAPVLVLVFVFACQKADSGTDQTPTGSGSGGVTKAISPPKQHVEQVAPPFDLKTPPADAVKTASGLIYKKLVTKDSGAAPLKNDTVLINYTGWKQSNGETFYTNRSKGQPLPLHLATTAPGFTEGLQLIKQGETAVLWLPPAIGYKGPPQGTPETLVYQIELVGIEAAPAIPADVAKPPTNAETLTTGEKYVVVKPGTSKDKAGIADTVTFNFTAWDSDGRMFDTTETRKRPGSVQPFKQSPAMEDILTSMSTGERARFWVDTEKMQMPGRPLPGSPKGLLCYEVEIASITKSQHEVPPAPSDVAKPPPGTPKTAKGTFYKVLKQGPPGSHATPTQSVRVNYTGWTTDGRMFDSSVMRGEPAEFGLNGVIAGWTDGIPLMSVGDKYRFWIPEELAYKGAPSKPQGMLVFDIELIEIKDAKPAKPNPHAGLPGH